MFLVDISIYNKASIYMLKKIIIILQMVAPVCLIVWIMIDIFKSVTGSNEDNVKTLRI